MITRLRDRRAENNVCSSGNSVTAAQLEGAGSIQQFVRFFLREEEGEFSIQLVKISISLSLSP